MKICTSVHCRIGIVIDSYCTVHCRPKCKIEEKSIRVGRAIQSHHRNWVVLKTISRLYINSIILVRA